MLKFSIPGMKEIFGSWSGRGLKVAIVFARFNDIAGERLLAGARAQLARLGVDAREVTLARVPGCFELPLAAKKLAARHDAVIALGVLIRGATPHFDHIAAECTRGLGEAALATGVPVIYGVLTCSTLDEAFDRAGGKLGNKGADAANAAVEMARLHGAFARPAAPPRRAARPARRLKLVP